MPEINVEYVKSLSAPTAEFLCPFQTGTTLEFVDFIVKDQESGKSTLSSLSY